MANIKFSPVNFWKCPICNEWSEVIFEKPPIYDLLNINYDYIIPHLYAIFKKCGHKKEYESYRIDIEIGCLIEVKYKERKNQIPK